MEFTTDHQTLALNSPNATRVASVNFRKAIREGLTRDQMIGFFEKYNQGLPKTIEDLKANSEPGKPISLKEEIRWAHRIMLGNLGTRLSELWNSSPQKEHNTALLDQYYKDLWEQLPPDERVP